MKAKKTGRKGKLHDEHRRITDTGGRMKPDHKAKLRKPSNNYKLLAN